MNRIVTTPLEKLLSLMVRDKGERAVEGLSLRNEVEALISWTHLSGDDLRALLAGYVADYDKARQAIRTKYTAEHERMKAAGTFD